ncbi:MAG TPA: hypothetical protein VLG50_08220 [Candidatus Saccharimonadales bacterium]|nr:hypothetical protein [Candidatus Saccharimonadales bacterium]
MTKIRAIVGRSLDNLFIIDIDPQGQLVIEPEVIHALANPFTTNIYVIETRESQFPEKSTDREKNIVRIYDQTMRNGVSPYPVELSKRIMDPTSKPDHEIKYGEIKFM